MPSDYESLGDTLRKQRLAGGHTLAFLAQSVRQERTGVHARVTLECDGAVLAWSNFNVERDEDRVRLANSAFKHLNGLSSAYPQTHLKHDLDQFCSGLWDAQTAAMMPVMMSGARDRVGPTFLIKPYILEEGGTILFAPPGRGKSYTLLSIAISLDAGVDALWPVRKRNVLFVNLERSARSIQQRIGNVNEALGLDRERAIATINARGRSLLDVVPACRQYINEHDIGCVFVDSISRAGAGTLVADDNVNRICDQLNGFGCAWFGLAHTPRNDETHLYGSIHFEAAADLVVQLLSEQENDGPLGVGLQLTKKNDVGSAGLWVGAFEFDELGLSAIRRARQGEFTEIERNKKMTMKETVMQHLLDVGAQDVYDIQDATGFNRSNLVTLLTHDEEFVTAGKLGKRQLYAVKA